MEILLFIAFAVIFVMAAMVLFKLVKNKHGKYILIGIPIFGIIAFAFSYIPHQVVTIDPMKVSKIAIFDGNTGESFEITDRTDIKHIIHNLNETTFQKGKPSVGYMGYRFNTKIFDQEGDLIKELIINSDDTIRYKGFFYKSVDTKIAYDYIDKLVRK